MDGYVPRKLIFKAWNKESKLLMRLDSISCQRGELTRKDHFILQYTGMVDKQLEELYEMDVVLINSSKFLIQWSADRSGWVYSPIIKQNQQEPLTREVACTMVRLCSFFESEDRT